MEAKEFSTEWERDYALDGSETLIPRRNGSLGNFQPAMGLPPNASATRTDCPHLNVVNAIKWEDIEEWPGRSDSGPPSPDGLGITLPANTVVVVHASSLKSTSKTPYGRITIPGGSKLVFHDEGVDGPTIVLHTLGIRVDGVMEAGSPTCRLKGKINITLHGEFGNTKVVKYAA